ncbi:hypothetical protein [Vibrio crassostreae]|uniref:hypothetical protein n=1 Tax=Vibrio crassostreae TaxID=246167 RepID=UPI001B3097FB|nr:hypothetical protein [Vibrio crassostreae]
MHNRFFACDDGIFWTVYPNGNSNFPHRIKVEEAGTIDPSNNQSRSYAQVLWLGDYEGKEDGSPIHGEYVLHASLTTLAHAIEGDLIINKPVWMFKEAFGYEPEVGKVFGLESKKYEVLRVASDSYDCREIINSQKA